MVRVGEMPELKINKASVVLISPGSLPDWTERPIAREVWIMEWPDAGVMIPWPEGMTAKEAIIAWAKKEMRKVGVPWPDGPFGKGEEGVKESCGK